MAKTQSRFALNLLLQLAGLIVLGQVDTSAPAAPAMAFIAFILFTLFMTGLFYGTLRLFGARWQFLETIFQNFPIGFWQDKKTVKKSIKSKKKAATKNTKFLWSKFFSFYYLRYAGFLLVITAMLSLLFQIEWELYQKVILSFVCSIAGLASAEFLMKKKKKGLASFSALISFISLQAGLIFLTRYLSTFDISLLTNLYFWLAVHTVASVLFSFTLFRYESKYYAFAFFLTTYLSIFQLNSPSDVFLDLTTHVLSNSQTIKLEFLIPSLTLLSAILFWFSYKKSNYGLLTLNAFFVSTLILDAYTINFFSSLVALTALFVAQLNMAFLVALKEKKKYFKRQITHLIVLHTLTIFYASIIVEAGNYPEIFSDYKGLMIVGFAIFTFIAYALMQMKNAKGRIIEAFLDTAMLVATIGLLLQAEAQWAAIIFLIYSCLILSYGIFQHLLRVIIYGFVFLTIAMVRLYFVSPEIFNSFSGTSIILAIGVVLVLLSYKFEAVKKYIDDFSD